MSRPAQREPMAVYDGQTMIGEVVDLGRPKGFEAYSATETYIGRFPSHREAVSALRSARDAQLVRTVRVSPP